jgi:peptidoglycan/xylan/chitin deacetylase (PgdA/CDA1 family)
MYHRIGEPDHPRDIYCIRPDRFGAQMHALAEAGFTAVSIDEFEAWRHRRKSLPEGSFVLTFDDGFAGVHDYAAPILHEMRWPATVFLVTGKLGGFSDWEVTTDQPMSPHRLMNQVQLLDLITRGFSLHSHSANHHDLTTLDNAELLKDLFESRKAIAGLTGQPAAYLAYPYGRHDERVRAVALDAGYIAGYSVESGFNRPDGDGFRIRRLDIFGTDTPTMLLSKIRLGNNDGSFLGLARYYVRRFLRVS